MPTIDWTQGDVLFLLAGSGVLLIVLSLAIRYWSAKRGNFLVYAIGILGGLVLGTAEGLYYLLPLPDWFSSSAAWFTVDRGDIVITADKRSELEPEDSSYLVCKLHGRKPYLPAASILWMKDEGEMVKKGDVVVILEQFEEEIQSKEQKGTAERGDLPAEQIANCRMLAPCDGMVAYYVFERSFGWPPWLSQGEAVKEGQKLLAIVDPSKLVVKTYISQSQIARVKLGQVALIHVDSFPDRTFEAQVSHIGPTPIDHKPGAKEMLYPVWMKLSDPVAGLRARMSVRVILELVRIDNVLRVPTTALLHSGNKTICFVKSGRQIETRVVDTGISDSQFTAVSDGLKEGEQVLREGAWQRFYMTPKER